MPDPRSPGRITYPVTIPVFPINPDGSCACGGNTCKSPGKHQDPYGRTRYLNTPGGYAILTGAHPLGSGVFVIDCDIKPPSARKPQGVNGLATFQALAAKHGPIPDTLVVSTGGGGYHFFFAHPGFPVKNNAGTFGEGVDVRGEGGYVVGPGSPHVSGRSYTVIHDAPIAIAPAWVLQWPGLRGKEVGIDGPTGDRSYAPLSVDPNSDEGRRRVQAFASECRGETGTLRPAIQGDNGSQRLMHTAHRGTLHWLIPPELCAQIIREHYNPRCVPPWEIQEIDRACMRASENRERELCPGPIPEDFGAALTRASLTGLSVHQFEQQDTTARKQGEHAVYCSCGGGGEHRYKYIQGSSVRGGDMESKSMSELIFLLTRHPDWLGVLRYDAFAERIRAVQPPIKLQAESNFEGVTKPDLTSIKTWMECAVGAGVSTMILEEAVEAAARVHTVHPVREYLLGLPLGNPAVFDNLAGEWFGANDKLSNEMLKRFLVGAVRRMLFPGTDQAKQDVMLVLIGRGGMHKSKWIDTLWHPEWAGHQMPDLHKSSGADISNVISRKAVAEFGELEKVIRAGDAAMKDFLSREVDEFRKAYGRDTVYKPRQCVFIGNTNDQDWLTDPRGSERRYHPIQVSKEIPLDMVKDMRDAVWAAAVYLALTPSFQHWFKTDDEWDKLLVARHGTYSTQEPWEELVNDYVQGKTFVTGLEVYRMAIMMGDPMYRAKYGKKEQNDIGRILRKLGATHGVIKDPKDPKKRKTLRGWDLPQDIATAEATSVQPEGMPKLTLVPGGKAS